MLENRDVMAANIRRYMKENGKTRHEVCNALGFPYSTFSEWITGKKYPRIDKIELMANYFGCEKSDLIEDKTKQPTESELSEVKRALIDLIDSLSESEAAVLLASLKSGLGR
jgi:transcriptional regulator with XRE-family HTH domain